MQVWQLELMEEEEEGDEFTGVLVSSLVILFSYLSSVGRCGSWS
jgi:hypothetical protein